MESDITGIYIIKNNINNKVYIGQSIHIHRRIKTHKHKGVLLHRAIKKYGWGNFYYEILEECPLEFLNEKEEFYIEKYNSCDPEYGYNILNSARKHPNRGTPRTQETRDKIRNILKGRFTGKDNPYYGKKHSEETIKKMSKPRNFINGKSPLFGKNLSEEVKKKISQSTRKTKVIQIDKVTNEVIKIWNSITEAAIFLTGDKKSLDAIVANCKGRSKSSLGYKWKYLEGD